MSSKYINIDGISICYEQFGEENKESILLISGLGSQMTRWNLDFCQKLVTKGFHVIRFDNRDAGKSTFIEQKVSDVGQLMQLLQQGKIPENAYSLLDMAKDAIGLLDALKIEKAHIVGRSMGGIIAQVLAAEFPERVLSATIIMSTSLNPELPQTSPDVMQMMMQKVPDFKTEKEAFRENRLKFAKRISGSLTPFDEEAEWQTLVEENQRAVPAQTLGHITAMTLTGFNPERFDKIKAPTLIIHGTEDPIFPLACAEDLHTRIKTSKLLKIEGMGHEIPLLLNDKIVNAISDLAKI
ncbi:alpha/beta hydrolase [Soonwooa sp.]|uniref:alpha/beta fold hydrolase n=1 Tax=Soonwooa sp. TaxID=1938592 RepID=UPI002627F240|nr:alpha/beta hydrolase [Soonwooa sp.]